MTGSGLLLVATLAVPLAMVVACLNATIFARVLTWLPLAPIPGLLAALLERGDSVLIAPAPLRLTLALDDVGAMLLGGASLLWGAAGLYASITMRGLPGTGRFSIWWLLTLTGSLGVFIVASSRWPVSPPMALSASRIRRAPSGPAAFTWRWRSWARRSSCSASSCW